MTNPRCSTESSMSVVPSVIENRKTNGFRLSGLAEGEAHFSTSHIFVCLFITLYTEQITPSIEMWFFAFQPIKYRIFTTNTNLSENWRLLNGILLPFWFGLLCRPGKTSATVLPFKNFTAHTGINVVPATSW